MSLCVGSLSPGISMWTTVQESGIWGSGGGGGRGERGTGVFFNSSWQGRLVQFHKTPILHSKQPQSSRAQESSEGAMGDKGQ